MRVLPLAVLSAAATLLVLAVSFDTSAQGIHSDPCRASCHEQKSICIGACGSHPNAVECEAGCEDELQDCLRQCR